MKIIAAEGESVDTGHVGGVVSYHRAGVIVLRSCVKPIDRKTPAQMAERSFMVGGQRGWNSSLTPEDRATWEA